MKASLATWTNTPTYLVKTSKRERVSLLGGGHNPKYHNHGNDVSSPCHSLLIKNKSQVLNTIREGEHWRHEDLDEKIVGPPYCLSPHHADFWGPVHLVHWFYFFDTFSTLWCFANDVIYLLNICYRPGSLVIIATTVHQASCNMPDTLLAFPLIITISLWNRCIYAFSFICSLQNAHWGHRYCYVLWHVVVIDRWGPCSPGAYNSREYYSWLLAWKESLSLS